MKNIIYSGLVFFFLTFGVSLNGQVPEELILRASYRFMTNIFPDGARPVTSVKTWEFEGRTTIYVLQLEPEGWILMSNDFSSEPVIGFSFDQHFEIPVPDRNNPASNWFNNVNRQLTKEVPAIPEPEHEGWKELLSEKKSTAEILTTLNVPDLIPAKWNQNRGWNRFCPADPAGPGGYTYVGCVAVAMSQAMSAFQFPSRGKGSYGYYHDKYGTQFANFGQTTYHWDSMSNTGADNYNALLLYHSAVSVNMNFGPDGSGAMTRNASGALKNYFLYSKNVTYRSRSAFNDSIWSVMLNNELGKGRPLIYSGDANDGKPGHAFNIDGVVSGRFYHLNWGWGGAYNGYFIIDNLKPGTSYDFTKNQAAIFGIQPLYYPVNILLSGINVEVSLPSGSLVGIIAVVDEATDNQYSFGIKCDSLLVNEVWTKNYYLDGDTLKTNREFFLNEIGDDTISIYLTDLYNNELEIEFVLNVTAPQSGNTGISVPQIRRDLVYPNPVNEILFINNEPALVFNQVRFYNISGHLVRTADRDEALRGINVSELQSGIYFLEIIKDQAPISITRFIKLP